MTRNLYKMQKVRCGFKKPALAGFADLYQLWLRLRDA